MAEIFVFMFGGSIGFVTGWFCSCYRQKLKNIKEAVEKEFKA